MKFNDFSMSTLVDIITHYVTNSKIACNINSRTFKDLETRDLP